MLDLESLDQYCTLSHHHTWMILSVMKVFLAGYRQLTNCFVGNVTKKSPSDVPKSNPRLPQESPHKTRWGKLGKIHWGSHGDLDLCWCPPPPVNFDSKRNAWPIFTNESCNRHMNDDGKSCKHNDLQSALGLSVDVHKVLLNLSLLVRPQNSLDCHETNICRACPGATFRMFFRV